MSTQTQPDPRVDATALTTTAKNFGIQLAEVCGELGRFEVRIDPEALQKASIEFADKVIALCGPPLALITDEDAEQVADAVRDRRDLIDEIALYVDPMAAPLNKLHKLCTTWRGALSGPLQSANDADSRAIALFTENRRIEAERVRREAQEEAERKHKAEVEKEAKRLEAEARKRDEEIERQRKKDAAAAEERRQVAEAEQRRLREEAAEIDRKRQAEAEEQRKKDAAAARAIKDKDERETERKRQETEAEGRRQFAIAEQRRLAEEAERLRIQRENEDRERREKAEQDLRDKERAAEEERQRLLDEADHVRHQGAMNKPTIPTAYTAPPRGTSVNKTYDYELVDISKVRPQFLMLNEKLVADQVKLMPKDAAEIVGGIRVFEGDPKANVRRNRK